MEIKMKKVILGIASIAMMATFTSGASAHQAWKFRNAYEHNHAHHHHAHPSQHKGQYQYLPGPYLKPAPYQYNGQTPYRAIGGSSTCTVAALTRHGTGRIVRGTRSTRTRTWPVGTSQYRIKVLKSTACIQAAQKCNRKLARRKRHGRNRHALCKHI